MSQRRPRKRRQAENDAVWFAARVKATGYKSYADYLASDHWRWVKRRYARSRRPKLCYVCGTTDRCDLHHRTYARLGHERLTDLLPLCRACHQACHDLLRSERGDVIRLWTVAAELRHRRGGYSRAERSRRAELERAA